MFCTSYQLTLNKLFIITFIFAELVLVKGSEPSKSTSNKLNSCEGKFHCQSKECIQPNLICNGVEDCDDGSDEFEETCIKYKTQFECRNGVFIGRNLLCNGVNDCEDGLDEDEHLCLLHVNKTSCDLILPSDGMKIKYKFGIRNVPYYEDMHVGIVAEISCNVEDKKSDSTSPVFYNFCQSNGKWFYPVTNCPDLQLKSESKRTCGPLLSSRSLKIQCSYDGKNIPCSKDMQPGATARSSCNAGYRLDTDSTKETVFHNFCQYNGEWIQKLPECSIDCGVTTTENVSHAEMSVKSTYYPWYTIVYFYSSKTYIYTYICGGTLITPFSVLTSAKCAYTKNWERRDMKKLRVGLGKQHIVYSLPTDITVQHFDIEHIYIHPRHKPFSNDFDIAIFELKLPVSLNQYIMPACMDFKYSLTQSSIGKVLGWNLGRILNPKSTPQMTRLTYIDLNDCLKSLPENLHLENDNACGLYINDSSSIIVSDIYDRGSGVTFEFDNRNYIFGVVHRSFVDRYDATKEYYSYVDLRNETISEFIQTTLNDIAKKHSIPESKCAIPYSPGTKYSRTPCLSYDECDDMPANEIVDSFTNVHINCMEGYGVIHDGYQNSTCIKGKWLPEQNSCIRLCKPLVSKSMWIQCKYEGETVDCEKPTRPGTSASADCKTGYISLNTTSFFTNECLENGEWKHQQPYCTHSCGILHTPEALIQDGVVANKTHHPWNAAVYKMFKKSIFHICGGTVLTPYCVLTAAHCVYNQQSRKIISAKKFKVGLGKEYRDFSDPRDENAQHIDVLFIHLPNLYDGSSINYLFDVAIFELKSSINLSKFVIPACIDMSNDFRLAPSNLGTVVGWGYNGTEKNAQPNPILHKALLPYIDRDQCLDKLPEPDKESLTKDKFCAFYTNGTTTSVRQGDSGSGIIFEFNRRFYVYGIVSTQINDEVSTFTDIRVPFNRDFIFNTLRNITRKYNSLQSCNSISQ